jgi:DNA-binding CsgD family transcriptional regulator
MPDLIAADDETIRRLRRILAGVLAVIVVAGATDLLLDRPQRWLSAHVVLELAIICGAAATAIRLWRGWLAAERTLGEARVELARHAAEREAWRAASRAAVDGLRQAIGAQFGAWNLTDAERDVAMHLLQGHSHKVIASRTGRSERTVRQHAVAVYAKSGLRGRAELAAFFLDDLLTPRDVEHAPEGNVQ